MKRLSSTDRSKQAAALITCAYRYSYFTALRTAKDIDFRRNVNQQTVLEAAPIGVPEMKLLSWEHENWLPDTTNDEAQASAMPISAFSAQLGT